MIAEAILKLKIIVDYIRKNKVYNSTQIFNISLYILSSQRSPVSSLFRPSSLPCKDPFGIAFCSVGLEGDSW